MIKWITTGCAALAPALLLAHYERQGGRNAVPYVDSTQMKKGKTDDVVIPCVDSPWRHHHDCTRPGHPRSEGHLVGEGKSIVFGSNAHHGGPQTPTDPPRVSEIEVTHVVEGQEGNVAWGRSSSAAADTKEPFAWALSNDNRSILGAD